MDHWSVGGNSGAGACHHPLGPQVKNIGGYLSKGSRKAIEEGSPIAQTSLVTKFNAATQQRNYDMKAYKRTITYYEHRASAREAVIKSMAGDYSRNVSSNGFLSLPVESKALNSKRGRSISDAGSEQSTRSSLSRITYVEEDAQIAVYPELEDSDSIIPANYTCLDRLIVFIRILFCLPIPMMMKKNKNSPKPVDAGPFDMESSPWVLSVSVLSTRKDSEKKPVPKHARCTIDTGNMQGNIVSRDFVQNVLEFSEANFGPLTAEEKKGGFGITGDKLVPEGAIYLTWYHSKSTRVFHSMRFLISPHSQCDLIIGARSILKDNLLGVPNLMATAPPITRVGYKEDLKPSMQPWIDHGTKLIKTSTDREEQDLEKDFLKLDKRYQEKEVELLEEGEDTDNNKELKEIGEAREVAKRFQLIRKAELKNDQKLAIQLQDELEKLPGYKNYVVLSKPHTDSSGTEKNNDLVQRIIKKTSGTSPPKR
ncbi:hypothetical protein BGAL_0096g00320 [Botrytis galanthina]|uniref:Uncharacterized protein n=1 Tax=Botrytis galanthina TaxID=278940 RepID=A0A4S8R6K0_9HELO|nr:hypothetical protein BGAL_0096g00320 [Botrytis galanthina]